MAYIQVLRATCVCLLLSLSAPSTAASVADRIIEMPGVGKLALSPDGKWIATRWSRADIASNRLLGTWMLIPTAGGAPRNIPNGDNPASGIGDNGVEMAVWSQDSSRFYFRSLVGDELAVWEATVSGTVRKLTFDDANVEAFEIDHERNRLLYQVGATRAQIRAAEGSEYKNGVVLDEVIFTHDVLQSNLPWRGRMTTLRLGSNGPYTPGAIPTRWVSLDLSRSNPLPQPVTQDEIARRYLARRRKEVPRLSGIELEPRGTRAAYLIQAEGKDKFGNANGTIGLGVGTSEASAGDILMCAEAVCKDVHGPAYWRPGTDEIVFVTKIPGGTNRLHAWNTRDGKVRLVFEIQGVIGSTKGSTYRFVTAGCPVDERVAYCTLSAANQPQRLVTISLDDGRVTTLFDPAAEMRRYTFPPVEQLTWKDRTGRVSTGVYVRPTKWTGQKPPLLITSYRCEGFLEGGNSGYFPEYAMVERGIAALCVNAERDPEDSPYPDPAVPPGQASRLQFLTNSWEAGAKLLVDRGDVDPARIGVAGHSFSGEGVNYAISHSTMFSVAGSGHCTVTDPFAYLFGVFESGERGRRLKAGYGVPHPYEDKDGYYRRVSPAMNAHKVNAAVLIQTGESEFRLCMQYLMELRRHKKAVDFIVFPDEPHKIWQPMHRKVVVDRFVDWFDFWMNGRENAAPEKVEQYKRWRRLRELRK